MKKDQYLKNSESKLNKQKLTLKEKNSLIMNPLLPNSSNSEVEGIIINDVGHSDDLNQILEKQQKSVSMMEKLQENNKLNTKNIKRKDIFVIEKEKVILKDKTNFIIEIPRSKEFEKAMMCIKNNEMKQEKELLIKGKKRKDILFKIESGNKKENIVRNKHKAIKLKNFFSKKSFKNSFNNENLIKIYQNLKDTNKFLGKKRFLDSSTNEIKDDKIEMKAVDFNPNIEKKYLKADFESLNKKYKESFNFKTSENHFKNQENIDDKNIIINPYYKEIRHEFASQLGFQSNFQESYQAIKLQKEYGEASSKNHFIKKKQSAVNIKRECGVSYVVETESVQKNVEDKYNPLGHLVYQGTHSIEQIQDTSILEKINLMINNVLFKQPLLISFFESCDEKDMKEYLLFRNKRASIAQKVYVVNSIYDIWRFTKDRYFLAINLIFDHKLGIRNYTYSELSKKSINELLSKSDIHIGILFRKATSGIKSVLKLYQSAGLSNDRKFEANFKLMNLKLDSSLDNEIKELSGQNTYTLSMRIELFVNKMSWQGSNLFCKEFLYTFICLTEEKISKLMLYWNGDRAHLNEVLVKENLAKEYFEIHPFYILKCSKKEFEVKFKNTDFNISKETLTFNSLLKDETIDFQKLLDDDNNISNLIKNNKLETDQSILEKLGLLKYQNILPLYIISTRDCFVFDLKVTETILNINGRHVKKKDFSFFPDNYPSNFHKFQLNPNDYRIGVITYEDYFSNEELCEIETLVEETETISMKEGYFPETAQKTFSGEKLKRTKFFFGARYMWTKKQLEEQNSYVAAGVRIDVSPPPMWIKEKVEKKLVNDGIILKDFVNSYAMNVYHDGSEGLGQHFDDAVRFKQPIYTVRTFSDCRLSFGSQLYGFCNGAFTIPLPRGCICVMEENSYSSNGVKHCIRPCDMTGKSSALILRQIHPDMVKEAEKYDFLVDFPCWYSCLSIHENSVGYAEQKIRESEISIKIGEINKGNSLDQDDEIKCMMNQMLQSIEYCLNTKRKNNKNLSY